MSTLRLSTTPHIAFTTYRNAGTDSRVFVQLFGIQGDSKPQELRTTKSLDSTFSRKSVDTFNLQLHKLGILSKLRVWLQGPGSPWHLELVVVRGPEGGVMSETGIDVTVNLGELH